MLTRITRTPPAARRPESGEAGGPTRTDVEARTSTGGAESGATDATPRMSRRGWITLILAIVALAGAATMTVMADGGTGQVTASAEAVSGPKVGSQEFLQRLAEQGYIPQQAVDRKLLLLERAVARGDIPAATLDAPTGGTVYSPAELPLIEAVTSGQVPVQALDAGLLERLRDEGRSNTASTARLEGLARHELERLREGGKSNAASTARFEGLARHELGR